MIRETYGNEPGDFMQVTPGKGNPAEVRMFVNNHKVGHTIALTAKDIPRLIAQLREAQVEPVSQDNREHARKTMQAVLTAVNDSLLPCLTIKPASGKTIVLIPKVIQNIVDVLGEPSDNVGQLPETKVQLGEDAIKCLKVLARRGGMYWGEVAKLACMGHDDTVDVLSRLKTDGLAKNPYGWHITPEGEVELKRAESTLEPDEVFIDTEAGISGKGDFVDGTVKNPVRTLAEAEKVAEEYASRQSPPEDTMEVRIAVVTGRNKGGDIVYGTSPIRRLVSDREAFVMAWPCSISGPATHIEKTIVSARVKVPPKPVVHEVEGKVEK